MSEGGEGEDRTEAPSEKRLGQARGAGQVALSREAVVLAVLAAATLMAAARIPAAAQDAAARLALLLEQAGTMEPGPAAVAALRIAVGVVGPVALVILLAGSAAVLVQTGLMFNASALVPGLGRLNPMHGLRRVFGPGSALEAGKSALKVAVAGAAAWRAIGADLPRLAGAVDWSAAELAGQVLRTLLHIVAALLAMQAVIAVLDVLRTRLRHLGSLRMTREELKQEHRESEGDPHVKARVKKTRIALSRRRMLAKVPEATLVVTNPTHYAVALAYVRGGNAAPVVVAKGVDEMAARIRAIAAEHKVPIVPNPPLARALHAVELDREIPAEHFKAVAELIAYVWRLRGQRGVV